MPDVPVCATYRAKGAFLSWPLLFTPFANFLRPHVAPPKDLPTLRPAVSEDDSLFGALLDLREVKVLKRRAFDLLARRKQRRDRVVCDKQRETDKERKNGLGPLENVLPVRRLARHLLDTSIVH